MDILPADLIANLFDECGLDVTYQSSSRVISRCHCKCGYKCQYAECKRTMAQRCHGIDCGVGHDIMILCENPYHIRILTDSVVTGSTGLHLPDSIEYIKGQITAVKQCRNRAIQTAQHAVAAEEQ